MFESKPIKRGGKIPFRQPKYSLKLLQQHKEHIFPEQQQLHNSFHFSQPLHLKETKQHGPSTSDEERKRRLDEAIPQNIERNRGNDQYAEDAKRYEENSRRNQYDNHGDGGNDFNS